MARAYRSWHGVLGLRLRAWNPGLVTGLVLLIPVGITGYAGLDHRPSTGGAIAAWAVGVIVHLGLVAFGLVRVRRDRAAAHALTG